MTLRLFPIRPYVNPPIVVPSSGIVIPLPAGDVVCDHCGSFGEWDYVSTSQRAYRVNPPAGEGWSRTAWPRYRRPCVASAWTRTVPEWFRTCCEQECAAAEHSAPRDEVCGDCDACYDHCECFHCESCGRECSDDMCSEESCYRCPRCCECSHCRHCGTTSDSVCGDCEYCDGCGCECGDDDDDDDDSICTVATYTATSDFGTRRFGVELEHTRSGQRRSAAALRAGGLAAFSRGYTKDHCDAWKTVSDCSISSGCEAVSPILCGPDGFRQLSVATEQLLANGGDTDDSCGTHIHVECSDLSRSDRSRLVDFYVQNADHFATLDGRSDRSRQAWASVPSLRAVSELCESDKRGEDNYSATGRGAVNLSALPKYGTIEFRALAGTLDYGRIERWIRVLFATVDLATSGLLIKRCETFAGFVLTLSEHGLPSDTADTLRRLYGAPSAL